MTRIYLFVVFIAFFLFFSCKNKTGVDLLLKTHDAITNLETVEYKVDYKAEYKRSDLKVDAYGTSFFDFTSLDSLLNTKYHFIYENPPYRSEQIFNGTEWMVVNWEDSTLMVLFNRNNEGFKKTIKCPFFIDCSYVFLNEIIPQLFNKELINEQNCILSHIVKNKTKYYKIQIKLQGKKFLYTDIIDTKNPEDFTKLEIIIDKKDYLPREISISNSKESHYSISIISEVKVNSEYPDSIWNINKFPAELRIIDPFKQNPLLPVGAIAPDWNLPTLKVDSLSLSSLKGSLVLLNFWSTGCGGCIKSIPSLNLLYQKYSKTGFEIIGITSNENEYERIERFIQKYSMNFPIVWKGETIEKYYQTWAHPTFYLLDKNGMIIYSKTGYNEDSFKELEKLIKNNI